MSFFRSTVLWLMVNKNKSCQKAWINAGQLRRTIVQAWALIYLLRNGQSIGTIEGEEGITEFDIFPSGLTNSTHRDVAKIQSMLGEWLDYASAKRPTARLESAMTEVIARLVMQKRGWIIEHKEPFPFQEALAGVQNVAVEAFVCTMTETFSNAWVGRDYKQQTDTVTQALIQLFSKLGCHNDCDKARKLFGLKDEADEVTFEVMSRVLREYFNVYSKEHASDTINAAIDSLIERASQRQETIPT